MKSIVKFVTLKERCFGFRCLSSTKIQKIQTEGSVAICPYKNWFQNPQSGFLVWMISNCSVLGFNALNNILEWFLFCYEGLKFVQPFKSQWLLYIPLASILKNSTCCHKLCLNVWLGSRNKQQGLQIDSHLDFRLRFINCFMYSTAIASALFLL